jgi:predicted RNase H-like HicB family nuclease
MEKKNLKTKEYAYTVTYEPVEEGGYQVIVPLLPGLITYGRNFEEARKMARDALRCHIEGLAKEKESIPQEKGIVQERLSIAF